MNKISKKLKTYDPSNRYFEKQCRLQENLIFITYKGKVEGIIERIQKYNLKLTIDETLILKHEVLYLYKPEAIEAVAKNLKIDDGIAKRNLEPIITAGERLKIPYWVLRDNFKKKKEVKITLRNGHVFSGKIHMHGVFSIRLQIAKDSRIIIMRPAIHDLCYKSEGSFVSIKDLEQNPVKPKKSEMQKEVYPVEKIDYKKMDPIEGKMECTIKITELPENVRTTKDKWKQFIVVAEKYKVLVTIKPKFWNKITKAAEDYEYWIAVINGKIGKVENDGFDLVQPGVQVFERKVKD